MQNLPPKDIARSDTSNEAESLTTSHEVIGQERVNLRARSSTKITLKPTKQRCSTKTTLQTWSAHAVGASYSGL